MLKGEVRNAILDELEKLLGPVGFRIKRKTSELIRKTSSGSQQITFTLHDFNPTFVFSLLPSIRFDEIGEMYSKAVEYDLTDVPVGPRWGMGIHSEYFFDGVPDRFRVTSVEEIKAAVDVLRPGIVGTMIPFFEQCESLKVFETVINESDLCLRARAPYNSFFYIMASYLANQERLDEVLSKWVPLPDLPVINDTDRENLRRLVAYVRASRG